MILTEIGHTGNKQTPNIAPRTKIVKKNEYLLVRSRFHE